MVFLIVHKHLEIIHGKGLIVRDLWHNLDRNVHVGLQKSRAWYASINTNNFFKALHKTFSYIVHALLSGVNWIQSHLHRLHDRLKSQKPRLDSNGSASVYLKQMSEAKKEQGIEK